MTHFSLEKFGKSNIFIYLCSGIGEKSRTADALAYYFALTEKTSEICFGIVRFKKRGRSQGWLFPTNIIAMHTPLAWSILRRW